MEEIKRELTVKDEFILGFISEFGAVPLKTLKLVTSCKQKNLERLVENDRIEIESEVAKIKNYSGNIDNTIKVFKVLTNLIGENKISSKPEHIKSMDLPYCIMAKNEKSEEYYSFAIINTGKEIVQCKLISKENYGDVILIIEEDASKKLIKENLVTKVKKIIEYKGEINVQ